MFTAVIAALISFIVAVLMGRWLIPVFRSIKLGQKILDIGPRWHKSKEGTPYMGGLFFIAGIFIACGVMLFTFLSDVDDAIKLKLLLTLGMALLFGVIGVFDDMTKFSKKQNKGLTATQKLILQFLIAGAYIASMRWFGLIRTEIIIPFVPSDVFAADISILYYILAVVGIVFTVNAVNLTDGIDGLLSSTMLIVCSCFLLLGFLVDDPTLMTLSAAVFGGCAGFLVYNFHPAKVFMGDTGSLFLGGILCGFGLWLDEGVALLILVLFGIIYYIEALSVMIQVTSFKLTGKRVFKMSPIHHHFEMSGWSEVSICVLFSIITLAGCALTVLAIAKTYANL